MTKHNIAGCFTFLCFLTFKEHFTKKIIIKNQKMKSVTY